MGPTVTGDDGAVIAALRGGDEAAFVTFAAAHQATLLRLARMWVKNDALAEEVVQETWLTMLETLEKFEGRSALKTWLCGILVNVARERLRKEGRSVPVSSLVSPTSRRSIQAASARISARGRATGSRRPIRSPRIPRRTC